MAEFESVVDYSTKLDIFEGPLDLLLHLIKEAKIENAIPKINKEDIFILESIVKIYNFISLFKNTIKIIPFI